MADDRSPEARDDASRVRAAKAEVLDGVGREIAASFPGVSRLGGQIVAALYLAARPCSMDELVEVVGRAKSNVFTNLRVLESFGIVVRRREGGARRDVFELSGPYPDVIVGAYLSRLKRMTHEKVGVARRGLAALAGARGDEAARMRERLETLGRKYERFAALFALVGDVVDRPVDLERLLDALGDDGAAAIAEAIRTALARGDNGG